MEKEGRNLSFLGRLKGEVNTPLNVSADSLRAIADWDPDILARYSFKKKDGSLNKE